MMPMAILVVLAGGAVVVAFTALLARVAKLEGRVESLERRHGELVGMISDAIVGQGERDSLELKLRALLSDR